MNIKLVSLPARPSSGAYLLQAAGEAAGHALEWPADVDDLVAVVVEHADGEGAQRSAALPAQTVVLLHRVEHVLPQRVAHLVLVVALKTHQRWRERGDTLFLLALICSLLL